MAIERMQICKEGSDCTAPYKILMDSEMSLKDFVECILSQYPKEWGYIGINDGKSIFGNPKIEYSKGNITSDNFTADIDHKKVIKAFASGGWSRMDYLVTLEE